MRVKTSLGNQRASSHSPTCGRSSAATKRRIAARSSSCSAGERGTCSQPLAQHAEDAAQHLALQHLALARGEEVADGLAAARGLRRRRATAPRSGARAPSAGVRRDERRLGGRGAHARAPMRAASSSCALSRSTRVAYFAAQRGRGGRARRCRRRAPSATAARQRVCTTGVGTPDSDRIVTAASPIPSAGSSSSRS